MTQEVQAILTLLTITEWNFQNFAFPGYIFLIDGIIFILISSKVGKKLAAE